MGRMRDTYGTYERHIWDHMGDSPCGRFLYTCCTIIAQRERERERNRPLRESARAQREGEGKGGLHNVNIEGVCVAYRVHTPMYGMYIGCRSVVNGLYVFIWAYMYSFSAKPRPMQERSPAKKGIHANVCLSFPYIYIKRMRNK